jgi:hemoglobin
MVQALKTRDEAILKRRDAMNQIRGLFSAGLISCLVILAVKGSLPAADDAAGTISTKTIDQNLHRVLRDVINRGADLFNQKDQRGCFYLFQGALITARSQLGHHPDAQKLIDDGLAGANQSSMDRRAWALRGVIDQVRDKINPNPSKPADAKPTKPLEPKKPEAQKAPEPRLLSLWDRLGGESAVTKVVDDFFNYVNDDKIDFTRGGKIKLDDKKKTEFKKNMVAFISSASGGPIPYKGKSMKEAHKGMGITDAEFDATAQALVKALKKNGVKQAEIDDLISVVAGTRKEIVEKK